MVQIFQKNLAVTGMNFEYFTEKLFFFAVILLIIEEVYIFKIPGMPF